MNFTHKYRFGSVGLPLGELELKIADDGEIMLKGPNVFMGYLKDPEATKEALTDGWLHSGDLGEFDDDGFLYITGRKKDIIITAGGKNIAPKNLESTLKNHPLIEEAIVVGERRKYLTALVTLEPNHVLGWAKAHDEDRDKLYQSPKLRAEIQDLLDEMNRDLARVEQVKKFAILSRSLSVEEGELTPTLKVKRSEVVAHFSDEIEAMYSESETAHRSS